MGALSVALILIQAIVQIPVILHFWSASTYGVWVAIMAAVGFVIALDNGHQNYLGNIFNQQWSQSPRQVRDALAAGICLALLIGAVEVLLGVLLVASGRLAIMVGDLPGSVTPVQVAAAFLLYIASWVANSSVSGILIRLYPPAGLYARAQWFGIANRLLATLALIGSAYLGASILGAMFAVVIVGTIFNAYVCWDIRCRLPEMYPWWQGRDYKKAWSNFTASLVLTFGGIMDQCGSNGIVLLIAHAFSSTEVAIFTTVRTVANVALQGTGVLLNPVTPDLIRFYVRTEPRKLEGMLAAGWFFGSSACSIGAVIMIPFVGDLYIMWTRGSLPFDATILWLLMAAVMVRQWAAFPIALITGLNRLAMQTSITTVRTGACVIVAVILLPSLGLRAAPVGILAGELCGAFVATNCAAKLLRMINARLPSIVGFTSALQLFFAALAMGLFAVSKEVADLALFWTGASIIVLARLQWLFLPSLVKSRLRVALLLRPDLAISARK